MQPTAYKIVTKSGFEITIPQKRLENWEFIEALADMEERSDDYRVIIRFAKLLFRKDYERFKDWHRDEDGDVNSRDMMEDIADIAKNPALKN